MQLNFLKDLGYIINSFENALFSGFEVHVVNYPINNDAPFKITKNKNIFFYKRSEFKSSYEINTLIKKIKAWF